MTTTKKITLSHAQSRELKKLERHPDGYFGSCTNATMNALNKLGLADIEWSDPPPGGFYRTEKWVITQAGRDFNSDAEPSASAAQDEPACRGAWQLGTACGKCRRCRDNPPP